MWLVLEVPNVAESIEKHQKHDGKDVKKDKESSNQDEYESSHQDIWEVIKPSSVELCDSKIHLTHLYLEFLFV